MHTCMHVVYRKKITERNKEIYRDREEKGDTERDISTDTREEGAERQRDTHL